MGVINMAHGEFIMMGAYTGYVVQLWIPDYTTSLIVALPLAFIITFAAGVIMERLVIRRLIHSRSKRYWPPSAYRLRFNSSPKTSSVHKLGR